MPSLLPSRHVVGPMILISMTILLQLINNKSFITFLNSQLGKPRRRWTEELHHRFLIALQNLGGAFGKKILNLIISNLLLFYIKLNLYALFSSWTIYSPYMEVAKTTLYHYSFLLI